MPSATRIAFRADAATYRIPKVAAIARRLRRVPHQGGASWTSIASGAHAFTTRASAARSAPHRCTLYDSTRSTASPPGGPPLTRQDRLSVLPRAGLLFGAASRSVSDVASTSVSGGAVRIPVRRPADLRAARSKRVDRPRAAAVFAVTAVVFTRTRRNHVASSRA